MPFAVWIALMSVTPATAMWYAVRAVVTLGLLLFFFYDRFKNIDRKSLAAYVSYKSLISGVVVGLVVFLIWILPEQFDFDWYRKWFIVGEGGTSAIAESDSVLIIIRLIGSAFIISIAEELFFRRFLINFAGFWWMVALFAVEHDRWLVGAVAGIAYGWLYLRKGLASACIAHSITNLVLGLWVLKTEQWQFW